MGTKLKASIVFYGDDSWSASQQAAQSQQQPQQQQQSQSTIIYELDVALGLNKNFTAICGIFLFKTPFFYYVKMWSA